MAKCIDCGKKLGIFDGMTEGRCPACYEMFKRSWNSTEKEAIRLAEAAGDHTRAVQLRAEARQAETAKRDRIANIIVRCP